MADIPGGPNMPGWAYGYMGGCIMRYRSNSRGSSILQEYAFDINNSLKGDTHLLDRQDIIKTRHEYLHG